LILKQLSFTLILKHLMSLPEFCDSYDHIYFGCTAAEVHSHGGELVKQTALCWTVAPKYWVTSGDSPPRPRQQPFIVWPGAKKLDRCFSERWCYDKI
jgi:hypothetical protein